MLNQLRTCLFLMFVAGAAGLMLMQTDTEAESTGEPMKLYRHVVLFKFKADATPEQIAEIVSAFEALQTEIDSIVGYEHGTDVSPEKLGKGFTHCFLVTFRDKADLEAYLPHPAHQAFTKQLKPILADVLVVDYWTTE